MGFLHISALVFACLAPANAADIRQTQEKQEFLAKKLIGEDAGVGSEPVLPNIADADKGLYHHRVLATMEVYLEATVTGDFDDLDAIQTKSLAKDLASRTETPQFKDAAFTFYKTGIKNGNQQGVGIKVQIPEHSEYRVLKIKRRFSEYFHSSTNMQEYGQYLREIIGADRVEPLIAGARGLALKNPDVMVKPGVAIYFDASNESVFGERDAEALILDALKTLSIIADTADITASVISSNNEKVGLVKLQLPAEKAKDAVVTRQTVYEAMTSLMQSVSMAYVTFWPLQRLEAHPHQKCCPEDCKGDDTCDDSCDTSCTDSCGDSCSDDDDWWTSTWFIILMAVVLGLVLMCCCCFLLPCILATFCKKGGRKSTQVQKTIIATDTVQPAPTIQPVPSVLMAHSGQEAISGMAAHTHASACAPAGAMAGQSQRWPAAPTDQRSSTVNVNVYTTPSVGAYGSKNHAQEDRLQSMWAAANREDERHMIRFDSVGSHRSVGSPVRMRNMNDIAFCIRGVSGVPRAYNGRLHVVVRLNNNDVPLFNTSESLDGLWNEHFDVRGLNEGDEVSFEVYEGDSYRSTLYGRAVYVISSVSCPFTGPLHFVDADGSVNVSAMRGAVPVQRYRGAEFASADLMDKEKDEVVISDTESAHAQPEDAASTPKAPRTRKGKGWKKGKKSV